MKRAVRAAHGGAPVESNTVRRLSSGKRFSLLAGTALITGLVGAFGSTSEALAACAATVAGQEWACSGAGAAFADTTTAEPWAFLLAGTVDSPLTPYAGTGTITINNNGDYNGTFQMNTPSTLTVAGHGIIINNNNANPNSTVKLNIGGHIDATGTGFNRDGIRLQGGYRYELDILSTAKIDAADDGIVVTIPTSGVTTANSISGGVKITVREGATITSRGGVGANGGDGIIVAAAGANTNNQIAGGIEIDNSGAITGKSTNNVSPQTSGGAALNLAAAGDITVTNQAKGTLTGSSGVFAFSKGDITLTNLGHIETNKSTGAGLYFSSNSATDALGTSTKSVVVKNLSLNSIVGAGDGIKGGSDGASVAVFNGDGGVNNPDGLINVEGVGILINNTNGATTTIFNGTTATTNSQIYAGGNYAIFARTRADSGDVNRNTVDVYNMGLAQTDNTGADAVVYGRVSADLAGSVFVSNGIVFDKNGNIVNANARMNAYTFSGGVPQIGDTNGIELVKMGGDGTYTYNFHNTLTDTDSSRTFGVAAENHGSWDFTRSEDYLSFNTWSSGTNGSASYGGLFAPGGSAVLVRYFGNSDSAYFNSGTTIGQGSFGDPVLDVRTTFYNGQTGQNQFYLYNAGYEGDNDATFGIIGSRNIPSSWSFSPDDLYNFGNLQRSGDFGYLEDNLFNTDDLQAFALAADDILLNSSGQRGGGARVWIDNDGVLVGRIYASTGGANDGSVQGFHMNNWGTWFTHSDNVFDFGANDEIYNYGLVQTATDGELVGITRFRALNLFENDGGLLSMMDGGEGDRTTMDGSYGTGDGTGYLGVDVFFAENNVGESDRLYIGDGQSGNLADTIDGSTGVVIHKTNEDPGGLNTRGIDVVEYDLNGGESAIENPCSGPNGLCKEGDAFYVDAASQDYENFAGYGTVRHGVFASVLRQDTNWDDFELVTDFAPDVALLPGLITGAQNIWHETGGVVRDHVYGNYFPLTSEGGSGADYMEPAAEPVSTGGAALWARISGSWTDRDTEVTQDFAGVPIEFDTSFDQDTYSILGGADYTMGNFRAGVFGGVIKSDLDFDSFDSSADYTGGTVGGYLAFTHGGFYADAEVKADFLDLDYDAAIGDASANVTNIGVLANTGYRMEMGRFFIEPNASLAYVNTDLDDDNVGGAEIDFSNGDSLRGGIGAKLGGTFAGPGGGAAEVAFVGKLWNEFEDENTVTLTDNITGDSESFTDDIDGIFGEVGGVATFWNSERTTSGFVSGGVQFNDDFLTVNARAGIRKRF